MTSSDTVERKECEPVELPGIELLEVQDYYSELLESIPGCENRALMSTLSYLADDATDPVMEALRELASEGEAKVIINSDSFGRLQYANIPTWALTASLRARFDRKQAKAAHRIQRLEDAGGQFNWVNDGHPLKKILYFSNTNHIKVTILDDTVYLGGANFVKKDLWESADVMVSLEDPELADQLEETLFGATNSPAKDMTIASRFGDILLDSGTDRTSLIYDRTCDLIDAASESVQFVSRFAPTGRIARALKGAVSREVDVECVRIANTDISFLYKPLGYLGVLSSRGISVREQSAGSSQEFGASHMRMAIIDDTLVIGSHNLTGAGNWLNTAEIALITDEDGVADQARELVSRFFPFQADLQMVPAGA